MGILGEYSFDDLGHEIIDKNISGDDLRHEIIDKNNNIDDLKYEIINTNNDGFNGITNYLIKLILF